MNQLRFIRNVIYRLKRDYGSTAEIYYDEVDSVDLTSGVKTVSVQKLTVRKAVPLPRKVYDNPVLSTAIQELFRRAGTVEFSDRELMFDYKDLPSRPFDISRISYIIFNQLRYQVVSSSDYETHAVVVALKATTGAYRAAHIEAALTDHVGVSLHQERGT